MADQETTQHSLKKDKYVNARGGNSHFLDLFCSKCNQHLVFYQKDGCGRLLQMYLDKIFEPQELSLLQSKIGSKADMSNLKCPKCGALIGTPMIYEAERRLAFRLIHGSFVKKKSDGVYPPVQQTPHTHNTKKEVKTMQNENSSLDVLIINSPLFRNKVDGYDEDSLPPLGLGYIATDLLSNGITVELIDAVEANIPLDTILAIIRQKHPCYVALNVFTTNLRLVREIVESIDSGVRFIIGGLATKNLYQTILLWNTPCPVDIVVGEGDYVVSAIVQEKFLEIIHQDGNKRVIAVSVTSPYFPNDISSIPLDRSFFVNQPLRHALGFNEVSIITSRGCMYNCAFCSAARSLNREIPIRERNAQSVANEVRMLCELYQNVNSVRVLDDLFLRNAESVKRAICMFGHVPVTWRAMAHVLSFYKLSDAQLLELKRSGCMEVFIGIESGSPRILKMIHKTSDVDLVKRTIERLFRASIDVKGYFIFGFETETIEDMQMSYDLAAWLKDSSAKNGVNFRASVFQFRPYHGTELYHDLILKGKIIDEVEYYEDLSVSIWRKQFNFTSGNFSEVSDEVLRRFIIETNGINR